MRSLLAIVDPGTDYAAADTDEVFGSAETFNYFVNDNTLEIDLFAAGLGPAIKQICVEELRLGTSTQLVLDGWIANRSTLDGEKLIGFIERIGKGRFAQALAAYVTEETCPPYIEAALRRICDDVS